MSKKQCPILFSNLLLRQRVCKDDLPDGSHEVGEYGEGSDAEAAECGGGGDVPVQLVDHRGLPANKM